MNVFRWVGNHLGSLILAFLLALLVWVTAVMNADPNIECQQLTSVPLEIIGQEPNLKRSGDIPANINVRLFAPRSICQTMRDDPDAVRALVDLSGLGDGQHVAPVQILPIVFRPVRLLDSSPKEVTVRLETLATRMLPVRPISSGEPALGYTAAIPILGDSLVQVSGLKSILDQVDRAVIYIDLTDVNHEFSASLPVQLLNSNGDVVTGLTLSPERVLVRQMVERPGNVRDVTVRPITIGQQAEGYQLTYISVSPQVITLFSTNPQVLRDLPGFVETVPIDLTGATNNVERRVSLVLPEGVSVFGGEQAVLVQVGISAIERSKPLFALPIEVIGLAAGLQVELSITTVDVIVSGPGPMLDLLSLEDVRVFLDVTGLDPGLFSLTPTVEIAPIGVRKESVLPTTIEVTITLIPTVTPTPTGEGTAAPANSGTPAPTPTP